MLSVGFSKTISQQTFAGMHCKRTTRWHLALAGLLPNKSSLLPAALSVLLLALCFGALCVGAAGTCTGKDAAVSKSYLASRVNQSEAYKDNEQPHLSRLCCKEHVNLVPLSGLAALLLLSQPAACRERIRRKHACRAFSTALPLLCVSCCCVSTAWLFSVRFPFCFSVFYL